ncbi:MAG: CHASE2 domain-containing protein [Cyanobacteria bacterium P01_F01_bin.13]
MEPYRYQSGGSLPLNSPSYVVRQADNELYQALLSGTYCYVLNSRQMGKSSLRVRTVDRLLEAGVSCVEIELLEIGSQQITAPQWYGGMIQIIISSLRLKVNRRQWLRDHEDLSPVQRLGTFIEQVVLPWLQQPLVLFFDEIDSVLGLHFPTEEFFGLIRSCYEKRASNPRYRQLTIVMLGVAAPSDLMQDRQATPFNIGQAISLQGFTFEEAQPLLPGLKTVFFDQATAGLRAILAWTGGQPFLTQKLCQLVQRHGPDRTGSPQQVVDSIVRSHILTHWEAQDEPEHLRTIRNRLLLNTTHPGRLLRLYRQILKRGGITINSSDEQIELRFSGLVTQRQNQLRVFNRIYQSVFDPSWVTQQLRTMAPTSTITQQLLTAPLWQVPLVSVGITFGVMVLQFLGWLQPIELRVFDQLMRWRPPEPADERFLVITVNETDIQYQDRLGYQRTGGSLADEALLQILETIDHYQPRVVGVDFYHEAPYPAPLATQLNDRFIAVCEVARTVGVNQPTSIAAPPELNIQQVGFTDFALDPDYRVRRQIIGMDGSNNCPTRAAFSLRLALRYLQAEGISLTFTPAAQIGPLKLPRLTTTSGSYQMPLGELRGHQLMINYRSQNPQSISLENLLSGQLDNQLAELVNNRIVLIGLANTKDNHFISGQPGQLPGVIVHAHMASQLLSAVLDQRPLIRWWPNLLEILWIGSVSLLGSFLVWWKFSRRYPIWILISSGIVVIIFIGYGLLLLGVWIPTVPTALAWTGSMMIRNKSSRH